MTPAVQTKNLTKHYGDVQAVRNLDLGVSEGEVYGFLGLNGAGKTTTVRMLTGVLPPTSGEARVCGVDVLRNPKAAARHVGVVFGENVAPEPAWSPIRYLRHFGRLYGLPETDVRKRAEALFDVLRLEEYAERPIGKLSGGNRRKVELARALLHQPDVLFLDEPTRELDIPAKRSVWNLLKQLARDEGLTIFLSSHDAQEIASLCTRIAVLQEGRLAWEGTRDDLTVGNVDLVDALAEKLEGPADGSRIAPGIL